MEKGTTVDLQASATAAPGKSKLRYPLRSAIKQNEKPPVANTSVTRRGRASATLSKSISVTESGKGNHATVGRPKRRSSVPTKSPNVNLASKSPSAPITPISETQRLPHSANPAQSETPRSCVSRASNRKKFSILPSPSYWLSQIKLSESEGKHSVSLGFFRLAIDAGCGAFHRLRDELKSYATRNQLADDENLKELLQKYVTLANEQQSRSSDDEVRSSCSSIRSRNPRTKPSEPRSGRIARKPAAAMANRFPSKNSAISKSLTEANKAKPKKATKQDGGKRKPKEQEKKEETINEPESPKGSTEDDKENKNVVDDA